jgi:ComEC/Rec2-related protein
MSKLLFRLFIYFQVITLFLLIIGLEMVLLRPPFQNGQKVRIRTQILSEPLRFETSQYLKIEGLKTYLPLYPEISYGDEITVEGLVEGNFIGGKLNSPKLINIKESEGVLYVKRKNIISFFKKTFPEPYASLVAGVTIGSKSGIPGDFWEKLKLSGTAHVVVASGMNISFVGGFILSILLTAISRRKAVTITILFIWTYAFMVGFEAPIVRAAIMGSVLFISQLAGRINTCIRSLVLSAMIMLLVKPIWILDLGFWLSFVATLSLILFQKRVDGYLTRVPGVLREGLSTSLAAQIGVAPILYFTFGSFNIFSPVINALVLWTIAPITIIGMISGILSIIIPSLGSIILWLGYPLAFYFCQVVQIGGSI